MSEFNPVSLIAAKRAGNALSSDELKAFVDGYTDGTVPDYQMSAFLMAAYLNGLTDDEASAMTEAMLASGTRIDLSTLPGTKVGKHSTGGVGDKVSPILVPIVASCGVPVAKLSGRGLGHTGGTLDKLESIPGFRTDLTIDEYRQQIEDIGLVISGQTGEIAPADGKLYALRDVTATVDSIPLIAASIMSKKLAEGVDALVLDVKCGRGAFMKTESDARALAETMVSIGQRHDTPAVALMTNMDVPLGRAVGNWPEIEETISCLQGHHGDTPLMQVVKALAAEMMSLADQVDTVAEGRERAREAIESGEAFATFRRFVQAQGGSVDVIDHPDERPNREEIDVVEVPSEAEGYVTDLDALSIGEAVMALGAGRQTKEDEVDPVAGLSDLKTPGDPVAPGDVLARLHGQDPADLESIRAAIQDAYTFGTTAPTPEAPVKARYTKDGWTVPQ